MPQCRAFVLRWIGFGGWWTGGASPGRLLVQFWACAPCQPRLLSLVIKIKELFVLLIALVGTRIFLWMLFTFLQKRTTPRLTRGFCRPPIPVGRLELLWAPCLAVACTYCSGFALLSPLLFV